MNAKITETLLRKYLLRQADESLLHFVAVNAHAILYWTMDRFCEQTGISVDGCMAFLSAFGVSSMEDFKNLLRIVLYQDITDGNITQRSISSISNELIDTEIGNLRELARTVDYDNLQRLTNDVMQATDVLVIGAGGAAPYAIYFREMLNKLGVKAYKFESVASFLNSHDPSTLVISFGIARYSKRSVLQLRNLRQHGFRVVGFTDRFDSPWVDLSDYCFFMPLRSFDFVDSYTTGFTLINMLLLNIGKQNQQNLLSKLSTHDAILGDMDIWF